MNTNNIRTRFGSENLVELELTISILESEGWVLSKEVYKPGGDYFADMERTVTIKETKS